jgi:hypothetical protein
MKNEYDIFKEGEKPPKYYIDSITGLAKFIINAFDNDVLIREAMFITARNGVSYLHIAGDSYPSINMTEIQEWRQGNHPQNLNTYVNNEKGVVMPIKVDDKLIGHWIKNKSFGCKEINVMLNVFHRFADEFHMFYTEDPNQEGKVYVCVFAKLGHAWFTNFYKQWGTYLSP